MNPVEIYDKGKPKIRQVRISDSATASNNMQEIITKAGPGSIAEALICGLPIVLSGFIPGQEAGNVPFVVSNGVGVYRTDPDEIAEVIRGWFGVHAADRQRLAQNALRLARPQATFQIVGSIAELLAAEGAEGRIFV